MLIDIKKFVETERPNWVQLEAMITRLEKNPLSHLTLDEVRHFHYLYERVSSDLAKLSTFAAERDTRQYLESLVARAYGQIHETRQKTNWLSPLQWFTRTFPQTFRRHIKPFWFATAIVTAGAVFGGTLLALDPSARAPLMPFDNLLESPTERVKHDEARQREATRDPLEGQKAQGSAWYMQNNIRVAITTMALGATWGIGTVVELFYTGIMVGTVGIDYVMDGQTAFLFGWLLPHGSVEIPAILLAGQAGFLLAGAIIGWGTRIPFRQRMRKISRDLMTLICGVALMLVWAGIVEACLSQYHEPIISYGYKIAFGSIQLVLLILFLSLSGREKSQAAKDELKPPTMIGSAEATK